MNDNEIIRVLELCITNGDNCSECPYCGRRKPIMCVDQAMLDAYNLIKRLQAEIERLKRTPKCVYAYDGETMEYCVEGPCSAEKTIETIKSAARKEFVESIKSKLRDLAKIDHRGEYCYLIGEAFFDNLLEEMEKENGNAQG